jgi:hypothetical protein
MPKFPEAQHSQMNALDRSYDHAALASQFFITFASTSPAC